MPSGNYNKSGRGFRRSGRGSGRTNGRNNGNNNTSKKSTGSSEKKEEMKFVPFQEGKGNKTTFETVKAHVLSYVKRTYKNGKDVVNYINTGDRDQCGVEPVRQLAVGSGTSTQELFLLEQEQKGLDIKYADLIKRYNDRMTNLEDNIPKVSELIYSYCNTVMQARLRDIPDYETRVMDDPIIMLQEINNKMYDPTEEKYEFETATRVFKRMFGTTQEDGEDLLDYTKRFKQSKDNFSQTVGKEVLNKFIETTKRYKDCNDDVDRTLVKKQGYDSWMTYLYISNADKRKYGTLTAGFRTQYALENDQYPKTLIKAHAVLKDHRWDNTYHEHVKKQRAKGSTNNNNNNNSDKDKKSDNNNKEKEQEGTSLNQTDVTCFCCGKKGHYSDNCPEKDTIAKEDWAVKKGMNLYHRKEAHDKKNNKQQKKNNEEQDEEESDDEGWMGLQFNTVTAKKTDLSNDALLDCGATFSSFKNENLVRDIETVDTPIRMRTNVGTRKINQKAEIPGMKKKVWFDEESMANIFSFSEMSDMYHIYYDNSKEDTFYVGDKKKNKYKQFPRTQEGLYAFKFSDEYKEMVKRPNKKKKSVKKNVKINLLDTVENNMEGYTEEQIKRAKNAKQLYHKVGTPGMENFKYIIKGNMIKDCPVNTDDINNMMKIWGKDIAVIKGKTVRRTPRKITNDIIEIPKELYDNCSRIQLHMDVFYVNGLGFLATIGHPVYYRTCVPLEETTGKSLYKALDKTLRTYNRGGFKVRSIECDNEFKSIMDDVEDGLGVKMNYTNAQDHVPAAERNNRTIKEAMRTVIHRIPYKRIPPIMIKHLAIISTDRLNWFPAKYGISKTYSPMTIITGKTLEYKKHCVHEFGAYVQAHTENVKTSSMTERGIDAIYLRPNENRQGGHYVMNLNTGNELTRGRCTAVPLPSTVKEKVEEMALEQGISTVKFTNKKGVELPNVEEVRGEDYVDAYDNIEYDREYVQPQQVGDIRLRADDDVDDDEIDELLADEERHQDRNDDDVSQESDDDLETDDEASESDDDKNVQTGINNSKNESESESGEESDDVKDDVSVETTDDNSNDDKVNVREVLPDLVRRSGRNRKEIERLTYLQTYQLESEHNIFAQSTKPHDEYSSSETNVIATYMEELEQICNPSTGTIFSQQYLLEKGLKKFGKAGYEAILKEVGQLDDRKAFEPISVKDLTNSERKKAQIALSYLTEKRDGTIKGRTVYNGKPTREWLNKEDSASPTASLDSILLTAMIDAHENRDIMTTDVPNAFIQTPMEYKEGEEKIIMKITGSLVDILINKDPLKYGGYAVFENGKKVLYLKVLRAIYGMLQSALLWYRKFRSDLEGNGFIFNSYDGCVANKVMKGSQMTVRFHVDDCMSSHIKPKANDEFLKWLNKQYGEHGEVKAVRGQVHDYLGMTFHFGNGEVKIDMVEYVENMLEEFPVKFSSSDGVTPAVAGIDLFKEDLSKKLDMNQREQFHRTVAKALFLCKRARPDIQTATAVLCSRVKAPGRKDWTKLIRMMKFLHVTKNDMLTLSIGKGLYQLEWYIDAAFGVHPDYKGHTGAALKFKGGKGSPLQKCSKQKLNTSSSTTCELVGVDDTLPKVLWVPLFLREQGYEVTNNIVFQDNTSAILLEKNGKRSSGERTRALNIRFFLVTDHIEKGDLTVEHCPTEKMIGDFFTKPLQGKKFEEFRREIMGFV